MQSYATARLAYLLFNGTSVFPPSWTESPTDASCSKMFVNDPFFEERIVATTAIGACSVHGVVNTREMLSPVAYENARPVWPAAISNMTRLARWVVSRAWVCPGDGSRRPASSIISIEGMRAGGYDPLARTRVDALLWIADKAGHLTD